MSFLYKVERACKALRHNKVLGRSTVLWDTLRPVYNRLLGFFGRRGLERNMNGTDLIKVHPELRDVPETYEPQVWSLLAGKAVPGARFIDVGAHVGLYAVALGRRVAPTGRVLAVEPEPGNLRILRAQVALNGVESVVTVVPCALSDKAGEAMLEAREIESRVTDSARPGGTSLPVKLETLDALAGTSAWDILLVDVEGFEEKVLRGGRRLLASPALRPHTIVIEVHPYAWAEAGGSSSTLLNELSQAGYTVSFLDGTPVRSVETYGHIVATAPVER